ncbi:XdhC family protein, partial [Lachnospiraceae bacterium OttesenSCG-928-J05]|nr:XdhC family protein [Lachnospiraceae bacterium OttesenSCG-928-J05]
MRELFACIKEYLEQGEDVVLVTIVSSSGSTPRGMGAKMLVTKAGRVLGTIGGGQVEHVSEQTALSVLAKKQSQLSYYQLKQNEIQDLGMICGGDVTVYE